MSSADASLFGLGTQMFSEVAAGVLLGVGIDYMLGTKGRWVEESIKTIFPFINGKIQSFIPKNRDF